MIVLYLRVFDEGLYTIHACMTLMNAKFNLVRPTRLKIPNCFW